MIGAKSDVDQGNVAAVRQRWLQQVAWLQLSEGDRTGRAYRSARHGARVGGHP
jgi:hypothetical protein